MTSLIKSYREAKCLTQQELAEMSGISLRTIQRIEKGSSQGSPYVIKTLCKHLEIDIQALIKNNVDSIRADVLPVIDKHHEGFDFEAKQVRLANTINLSALLGIFLPLLNLLFPFYLYRMRFSLIGTSSYVRRVISFQIMWTVFTIFMVILIPSIVHSFFPLREYSGYPLFVWIYFACLVFNVGATLYSSVRIQKNQDFLAFVPLLI